MNYGVLKNAIRVYLESKLPKVPNQGLLYTWTDSLGTVFATFIIMKISKNDDNTIYRSSKIFTKFEGCGSKIEPMIPISIFIFSRVWQSYILSYALQFFVNGRSFIDQYMTFLSIFCNHTRKAEIWEKLSFLP